MSIGKTIKELRETKGLSQSELGKICGVSDKAVSTWENDLKVPRMGKIQQMADYFGVKKSDIIEGISQEEIERIAKQNVQQVEDLSQQMQEAITRIANEIQAYILSEEEKKLIKAYREQPEMQKVIKKILNLDD